MWRDPPGEALALIDRYAPAIEADLRRVYNLDLTEFLSGARSWRQFLNLLDHLPPDSSFVEALLADPDRVAAQAAQHGGLAAWRRIVEATPTPPPAQRTWSPVVEGIARVEDAVSLLSHTIAAALSGERGRPPRPAPRPVSAYEAAVRAADDADFAQWERTVAAAEAAANRPQGA